MDQILLEMLWLCGVPGNDQGRSLALRLVQGRARFSVTIRVGYGWQMAVYGSDTDLLGVGSIMREVSLIAVSALYTSTSSTSSFRFEAEYTKNTTPIINTTRPQNGRIGNSLVIGVSITSSVGTGAVTVFVAVGTSSLVAVGVCEGEGVGVSV